jgi:hypothetical protein
LAIRAYQVAVSAGFAVEAYWLLFRHVRATAPGESHTEFMTALSQERMELQPADADAAVPRETCSGLVMAGKECDAVEWSTIVGSDLNTKRGQIFACIRHQALAAGLVYGRAKSIGDQNI